MAPMISMVSSRIHDDAVGHDPVVTAADDDVATTGLTGTSAETSTSTSDSPLPSGPERRRNWTWLELQQAPLIEHLLAARYPLVHLPVEEVCEDMDPNTGYLCCREKGHSPPHVAHSGVFDPGEHILSIWETGHDSDL